MSSDTLCGGHQVTQTNLRPGRAGIAHLFSDLHKPLTPRAKFVQNHCRYGEDNLKLCYSDVEAAQRALPAMLNIKAPSP